MIAPHPFGHEIIDSDLIRRFNACHQWEDRYRQLILLGKQLVPLSETLKQPDLELSGSQNKVWLGYQRLTSGQFHFYGDSEGRIFRGLLAILFTVIEGKTAQQLVEQNPLDFFVQLGLKQQLSASRVNGLVVLAQEVQTIAQSYVI